MVRIVATVAVAALAVASTAEPITTMPEGYRDWPLISLARIGSPLNDLRAKLGNPVTMRAYKNRTLPFPDGAIIARLAWNQATSEENNQAFARGAEGEMGAVTESFVAGPATNVQFMIKNSKKYA